MSEQEFLKELEDKLWRTANTLRSNIAAALYRDVVLGMVFLKYVSDSLETRRQELREGFSDPEFDYYLGDDADEAFISEELENRDYYIEKNVFWVPKSARWDYIKDNSRLAIGSPLSLGGEFKGVDKFLDDTMDKIEKENPKLKNILNKSYSRLDIDQSKLADLVDLISTIPFHHESLGAKDILGHVYEYFLGKFALEEGQNGGKFYTPKSIVNLIVEMVEPYKGRVYDPAMGSGGFFVSSEKFINEHSGSIKDISIYGQESDPTTWRLAVMNMVIRGIDFDFGKVARSTFTNDQHPDLRADFVLANPPFNQDEDDWWDASLEGDARWKYGTPPKGNANYGWIQHMLHHTSPNGVVSLVLSNGSLSTTTGGEDDIRKAFINADLVETIIALPSQLFGNTQIPACIWILNRNKTQKGKTLFIDARKVGYMLDRKQKAFSDEDTQSLAETFHSWRSGNSYEDIAGQHYSATTQEIAKYDYVLTPRIYIGATEKKEGSSTPIKVNLEIYNHWFNSNTKIQKELDKKISDNLIKAFPFFNWNDLSYSSNELLEEIVQTIFKSWFVDFDPVHAKKNAASNADYEQIAEELGISRKVLDLFPDEFEDSKLGIKPKGWNIETLDNTVAVTIGKTPPRKEQNWFSTSDINNIKWVSIKDMGKNGTYIFTTAECLTQEAVENFNVKVIPANTVILSFKLTVGRVSITTENMCTNEAIAHFVLKDKLSTEYVYTYLKGFDYDLLGSTSSIATAVNSKIIKAIPIVIPTQSVLELFNDTVKDIFNKIKLNSSAIITLKKTREMLLPKLLSGELDVSELELDNVTH